MTRFVVDPESGSFFRMPAGGERQSGPRPAAVLAGEIHEFPTDTSLKTWEEAIAKVATSAIMILGTNTPTRTQHVGTTYSDLYQDVALGKVRDDTAFAFVARIDKTDLRRSSPTRRVGRRRCRRWARPSRSRTSVSA